MPLYNPCVILHQEKVKFDESRWTFNAVGEFSTERNHRVLSVPCFSISHLPRKPYVPHTLDVQEALCYQPIQECCPSISDGITDEVKDTLMLELCVRSRFTFIAVGGFFLQDDSPDNEWELWSSVPSHHTFLNVLILIRITTDLYMLTCCYIVYESVKQDNNK